MKSYTGRLFKVLGKDQRSCHGGNHQWIPGEWVKVEGKLIPCQRGIHLCREQDLIYWLSKEIWAAEYQEVEFIIHKNKVVVREARITTKYENWNETTARLIACDFAEKVVHLCGDDPWPKETIRVARLFANGLATIEELAVTREVAWATARKAATRVADWAAREATAWTAAEAAAWAAAEAAEAATRATAGADRAEMRQWQTKRLLALLLK